MISKYILSFITPDVVGFGGRWNELATEGTSHSSQCVVFHVIAILYHIYFIVFYSHSARMPYINGYVYLVDLMVIDAYTLNRE